MGEVNPGYREPVGTAGGHVVYIPSSDIDPDRFWLSSAIGRGQLSNLTRQKRNSI
jgi:hypothetical protein